MAIAPWIAPPVLAEYMHNAGIRLRRQFRGHTRHAGDAVSIVEACIEACWNGRTFTASPGHFDMFWTRDLSFSTPALVRQGYGERAHASLAHALDIWTRRRTHITTTIHYFDRPAMSTNTASIPCRCSWPRCGRSARRTSSNATAPGCRPRSTISRSASSTR